MRTKEQTRPRGRTPVAAAAQQQLIADQRSSLLRLQRTVGNQTVMRLFEAAGHGPRGGEGVGGRGGLAVNEPGDVYEREADTVADRVMSTEAAEPRAGPSRRMQRSLQRKCAQCSAQDEEDQKNPERVSGAAVQRKCSHCEEEEEQSHKRVQRSETGAGPAVAPPSVHDVLRSPGQALDSATRAFMEPRFGNDFSAVRVHTDAPAAESARAVHSRAYTVGRHVVFAPGEYRPTDTRGQRLLAHELTHVVQQGQGRPAAALQRDSKPEAPPQKKGARFYFRLKVTRVMTVEESLREFVRQYYGLSSEEEVDKHIGRWHPGPKNTGTSEEDVKRGYQDVIVEDNNLPAADPEAQKEASKMFSGLGPAEQAAINEEANKEFWQKTQYKPGQKLGGSATDKLQAKYWMAVRNELLRKKKSIDDLPPNVKVFLFSDDGPRSVAPGDYQAVLNIAEKLKKLTDAELADYESKVNATSASWSDLEDSIDRYLAQRAEREKQAQEREKIESRLFGLEELYQMWKDWKSMKSSASMIPAHDEFGVRDPNKPLIEKWASDKKAALEAGLHDHGIASIEEFETLIETYRNAFRDETVSLAFDVLAKFEHVLYLEKKKYEDPKNALALAAAVGKSSAAAEFAEEESKESQAFWAQMAHDPQQKIMPIEERLRPMKLQQEAAAAHARGEAAVVAASLDDPLVKDRSFDKKALAEAKPDEVQGIMLGYIQDRYDDIAKARQEFKDDPDKIFRLDDLIASSMQSQQIDGSTIYGMIVNDHVKDMALKKMISQIVIGVLALALAILVPGGGWAAAIALTATALVSTVQAIQAYKEYEEQSKDYRLHFLSEDPSLFWVVVAFAGAALDIGASAGAIVKLQAALKAFSQGEKDLSALAKLEQALDDAADLQAEARLALKREAQAQTQAKAAWKEALAAAGGRANAMLVPDPEIAGKLLKALYYTIKRGVNRITALRKDAEFVKIMGDITKLSGKDADALKAAFTEVREIVSLGKAKNMDEAELLSFVDRWAKERGGGEKAFAKLKDDIEAFESADKAAAAARGPKPLTPEQQRALNAAIDARNRVVLAEGERSGLLEERKRLQLLQKDPATRSKDNLERLQEINDRLKELEDPTNKLGQKTGEGEITRLKQAAQRAEEEAAKLKLTLYDRIRAATPSDVARTNALKGVTADQVGALKTVPGKLTVDHIVSVREITEMEGFEKLAWEDQKAIADLKENLIVMDEFANSSKGDRTWKTWDNWKNYYSDPNLQATMIKRENAVRQSIRDEIARRLAK